MQVNKRTGWNSCKTKTIYVNAKYLFRHNGCL